MFSRSIRAVSGRVLATPIRPLAAQVSRQLAPAAVTIPRRLYHEKVLDRTFSPPSTPVADSSAISSTFSNTGFLQTILAREMSEHSTRQTHPSERVSSARLLYVVSKLFPRTRF